MRLTSFTEYSLRVLIFLAATPGRRATIGEIARTFGISENHLMKVVHLLGREGLLVNTRGKGGGLELAVAPEKIGIGKVVRTIEGPPVVAECFNAARNTCVISPVCRLHGVLAQAADAFYAVLDSYTLEDLGRNRRALAKVLLREAAQPLRPRTSSAAIPPRHP
ncbi:MAG TPA: Rrf2 family transcriptional regulator [Casimicrobiaceae bacterium]|nr:Rrf2 family transcriptional regulator [Casimicrobiaceae bacterium]